MEKQLRIILDLKKDETTGKTGFRMHIEKDGQALAQVSEDMLLLISRALILNADQLIEKCMTNDTENEQKDQ